MGLLDSIKENFKVLHKSASIPTEKSKDGFHFVSMENRKAVAVVSRGKVHTLFDTENYKTKKETDDALGKKADQTSLTNLETKVTNMAGGTFLLGEKANVAAIRAIANPKRGDTWKALDSGHYWTYDGSNWNDIGEVIPGDVAKRVDVDKKADKNFILLLFDGDINALYKNKRLSHNGGNLVDNSSHPIRTCLGAKVNVGEEYEVIGSWQKYSDGIRGLITPDKEAKAQHYAPIWELTSNGYKCKAPIDGYLFVDFELKDDLSDLKSDSLIRWVSGEETYSSIDPLLTKKMIPKKSISNDIPEDNASEDKVISEYAANIQLVKKEKLFDKVSGKNMFNEFAVDLLNYYSPGSLAIASNAKSSYVLSAPIPVKPGDWLTINNDKNSLPVGVGYSGGYFKKENDNKAIQSIVFITPVDNIGKCFQVPLDIEANYIRINIPTTDSSHSELWATFQIELGEQATEIEKYYDKDKIKSEFLPEKPGESPALNKELEKYTSFGNLSYDINGKLSKFRKHWIAKDKDLVAVNVGTSLTARSTEHCTEHSEAMYRPPLMHSNNLATHIWDKLSLGWGQSYRRYDSDFFVESGSFKTSNNLTEWDDGAYRDGLTRYSTTSDSSFSFTAPTKAWQFNLIFRTDTLASDAIRIDIAEGDGMAEVFDEKTQSYVEMNGFVFSQKESDSNHIKAAFFKPLDNNLAYRDNYKVKGNTTYQKRLKGRFKSSSIDSRHIEKHITYTNLSSGKMTYWGVEWSEREYMITFINAARGSHSSLIDSNTSLMHYIDNEVLSFIPDLILTENPIHNAGASGVPNDTYPTEYWQRVTNSFFYDNREHVNTSILKRAEGFGINNLEFVLFTISISWNFKGIDDKGLLIASTNKDGRVLTALDAQLLSQSWINRNDTLIVNSILHWIEACINCYKNLKEATTGSGKDGLTFTNEGSHLNDTGSRVAFRAIEPTISFK